MTSGTSGLALATAVVLAVGAVGIGGYALGSGQAPTTTEADRETQAAFEGAYEEALGTALEASERRGEGEGRSDGARDGSREGAEQGRASGSSDAEAELASQAAAEAEAEASAAADAEVFCPLAADNSATQAECDAMIAQESYCGGFDPDQVQPDGSYLPKPGC